MADDVESLAPLLRRLRQEAGLSNRALARASGVHDSVISRLESGKIHSLRPELLQRLARALTVDFEVLHTSTSYDQRDKLPGFKPYLRAKYGHLPDTDMAQLTRYFEKVQAEYRRGGKRRRTTGPTSDPKGGK